MKKNIYILLVLIVIFFFSCKSRSYMRIYCPNAVLLNCVESYIMRNETKIAIYDKNKESLYEIYYTLFFFEKDTMTYFTIWESFIPANSLFFQVKTNKHINILGRNIYIFNYEKAEKILFYCCNKKKMQNEEGKNIGANNIPIYCGSLYPETYRYYRNNANVVIEKLDTTLIDVR